MTALSLPLGATVTMDADALSVRHAGDVVIEQAFGRRLVRAEADGDIRLGGEGASGRLVAGTVIAGRTLTLVSDTEVQHLRGDVIEIGSIGLAARSIVATTRVFVAANARLNVDVIVAPEVSFHPDASGRVKLIDCLKDRPVSRVRGCLSLDDYEADVGDVTGFLARLGVTPLRPLGSERSGVYAAPPPAERSGVHRPPPPAERSGTHTAAPVAERSGAHAPPPPSERSGVHTAPAERSGAIASPAERSGTHRATPPSERSGVHAAPPPPPSVVSAPVSAPPPAPVERRPLPTLVAPTDVPDDEAPPRPAPTARQHTQLRRAWTRIEEAYAGRPPSAVRRLGELLERRPDDLASQLDTLWRDTLREHVIAGTQPPRVAVLGFHALRALAA